MKHEWSWKSKLKWTYHKMTRKLRVSWNKSLKIMNWISVESRWNRNVNWFAHHSQYLPYLWYRFLVLKCVSMVECLCLHWWLLSYML